MAKWFHSGRRRDLCALLYEADELRAQSLKSRLESHYDERIDPRSFYGTLSALVDAGYLERRTEGIADVYGLTEEGERALRDHHRWLTARVESGEGDGGGDGNDDGNDDDDGDGDGDGNDDGNDDDDGDGQGGDGDDGGDGHSDGSLDATRTPNPSSDPDLKD